MSKKDIEKRVFSCAGQVLYEKGYISPIDILIKMERITPKQAEDWRFKRIPYLERVTIGNLSKLNHILKSLAKFARERNLQPSKRVYMSWGKGAKQRLRFSKSDSPYMEELYSTHYVKVQKAGSQPMENDKSAKAEQGGIIKS
ncbi:hypothetical protein [Peribacillus cavernae]|uniref:hypothetical protein n=1 Tax=Peribacillus cavernae TaxID=1674310 RepID=UPI00163D0D85|nr:hypothetical protein [Peribacillus cavernae]MDQ0219184.1 hypothetical protein [Peribacillus cavernae]